ncbi:MAG TPA: phosphodiester glycosidase family protein [Gaiellaceae bacterium]
MIFAPAAWGSSTQILMPGVSYSRQVQFTTHGPVVIHVIVGPRPTGLYSLQTILSGGTITGRARVTSMEKAVSNQATVVGINGDLFNWNDGHPSGIVMQDGIVKSPPYRNRSSIGISTTGQLSVARVGLYGYWQGLGSRHPLSGVNKVPKGDGTTIFTPAWGARTPTVSGAFETVLEPFPPTTTGELEGTALAQATGGGTPIPRDGAVMMAVGSQASKVAAETPPPTDVHAQYTMAPDWPSQGITEALGGGPLVVRNGRAVYTSGEDFLASQLAPRSARTGVGQRRDGRIVMVVVDGRRPGYSVGLTNFELAQAMVRLGVVTGSALDSGGSSTLAFDGKLLNRPSDNSGERAVKETLALMYTGVYTPALSVGVISPAAGGGLPSQETLSYKVVRPSTVAAKLVGPDGSTGYQTTEAHLPGTYQLTWPSGSKSKQRRVLAQLALGRWRWVVNATDDQARQSSMERAFWVNDTLGFLRVAPKAVRLRAKARNRVLARFRLAHPATVVGTITTRTGVLVRRIGPSKLGAGARSLSWNGRYRSGRLAYRGSYVFSVFAKNSYGPVTLTQTFGVRR